MGSRWLLAKALFLGLRLQPVSACCSENCCYGGLEVLLFSAERLNATLLSFRLESCNLVARNKCGRHCSVAYGAIIELSLRWLELIARGLLLDPVWPLLLDSPEWNILFCAIRTGWLVIPGVVDTVSLAFPLLFFLDQWILSMLLRHAMLCGASAVVLPEWNLQLGGAMVLLSTICYAVLDFSYDVLKQMLGLLVLVVVWSLFSWFRLALMMGCGL
ncbi:hypothetical protein Nepgr_006694 [Nepenthes gracilis]|uniref:Uncharacterized protein n=1 Tax=Nepenthes gracilis TaxID=150966 RepID=A0AAD3S5U6_NEPGR|nr:hypothetical protein Nepgr_006694 [Nepenthes gracilis]